MAAPLNNTYGAGNHNAGRRAKFSTSEALYQTINSYFNSLEGERPTITGLVLFLGFASRQSLYDYAKKEAFSYPIKRALLIIENEYERMLTGPNSRAAIFALKNMGWSNKTVRTWGEINQNKLLIFSANKLSYEK